ncbi:hypothetical protein E5288_WYG014486 [Bos mutus]|uniref:E3 ubiquitin-protein ligase ZNRF1 n=1 Tax=Bos mutus TaxID=72004 RepID=A0A6B0R8C6_9CETA|nr:hypothetical protein [Bos mutus]
MDLNFEVPLSLHAVSNGIHRFIIAISVMLFPQSFVEFPKRQEYTQKQGTPSKLCIAGEILNVDCQPLVTEGFKCPVCSKFVPSDEMDLHLVMCLTKPRITYNEDVLSKDAGECAICLEELQQGDTIARLPCLCIYHKGCIDEWFEVSLTSRCLKNQEDTKIYLWKNKNKNADTLSQISEFSAAASESLSCHKQPGMQGMKNVAVNNSKIAFYYTRVNHWKATVKAAEKASEKAAMLFKQYVQDDLYDRINTRLFLNNIENRRQFHSALHEDLDRQLLNKIKMETVSGRERSSSLDAMATRARQAFIPLGGWY